MLFQTNFLKNLLPRVLWGRKAAQQLCVPAVDLQAGHPWMTTSPLMYHLQRELSDIPFLFSSDSVDRTGALSMVKRLGVSVPAGPIGGNREAEATARDGAWIMDNQSLSREGVRDGSRNRTAALKESEPLSRLLGTGQVCHP